MRITGSNVVAHPPQRVWEALLDPQVLVATIPGCDRLESTGENTYAMTVTAGVAAVKGTYTGRCALTDLKPHESLVMTLAGAGAPGTVDAVVDVSFDDLGTGGTRIGYTADATVGGMVGGVGQRMLASVSRRMAGQFFTSVGNAIDNGPAIPAVAEAIEATAPAAAVAGPAAAVSATPAAPPAGTGADPFVRGVGVGAGVALLGVLVGARVGRRR